MNIYLLIYLLLHALGIGFAIAMDGKPRGPHSMVPVMVGSTISIGLLYLAGVFS